MALFKRTLLVASMLFSHAVFSAPESALPNTLANTTWKFNKQSAYAVQHDDYCGGTQGSISNIVVPEMLARGLTASFGVVAKTCWDALWDKAREHVASGFTLFNHSMRHSAAYKPTWEGSNYRLVWDNKIDIDAANKLIAKRTGFTPTFMALPFDIASDESIAYVREHQNLIAMRAPVEKNGFWVGNLGINNKNFSDAYALKVELFHNWSPYWKLGTNKRLAAFLQSTIERNGFGIQYFHGVGDDSYYAVSKSEYIDFLDKLKKASDDGLVWVGDASEIVHYRFAREYCQLNLLKQAGASAIYRVNTTPQCSENQAQLTISNDFPKAVIKIQQAGEGLLFTQNEGVLQFEYESNKGDVEISF